MLNLHRDGNSLERARQCRDGKIRSDRMQDDNLVVEVGLVFKHVEAHLGRK